MGNINTNPINDIKNTNLIKQIEEAEIKDAETLLKIKSLTDNLIKKYSKYFLNKDFCNKIKIVFNKELTKLNVPILRNVNDTIENSIGAYIELDVPDNEKLIANEFHQKLKDYFETKNIYDKELTDKPIINNLNFFNPLNQQHGGAESEEEESEEEEEEDKEEEVNKEEEEEEEELNIEEDIKKILDLADEIKKINKGDLKVDSDKNNKFQKENKKLDEEIKIQNKEKENIKEKIEENKFNQKVEMNNLTRMNINDIFEKYSNKISNIKKIKIDIENKINQSNLQKEESNFEQKDQKKNDLKVLDEVSKNLSKDISDMKKNKTQFEEKDMKDIVLKIELSKRNKEFDTCNSKTKDCKLTKKELCEAISENINMRMNIIAAIRISIPSKNEDGTFDMNYCSTRLKNLKDCKFCIPKNFNQNVEQSEQVNQLLKFINHLDYLNCSKANGIFKELTDAEKEALGDNKNEFNVYYASYTAQLEEQYLNSLNLLLDILLYLEDNILISNQDLNELAQNTEFLLENMYKSCQSNYIAALLSFMKADLSSKNRKKQSKNIENTLSKGLLE
jgi:hypothetical protein